ncbi:hypothetical protein QA634_28080 [Methylobacterium sp. CB376]|uniref:hypothetical protein n=1 Tax=unclassified Methylobacterium TaxID=2615210 RepID=UPI00031399C9|nr:MULTISPECIES: hypothetical protein [Methylobacterium]WFT79060.1 hypothetical protein QA634_28080 [Methylobacterium nodulans]
MNTFTVTIQTAAGPLSVGRETAEAALESGRVLDREGVTQVFIAPPGGEPMPLAAFSTSLAADQPDWDPA